MTPPASGCRHQPAKPDAPLTLFDLFVLAVMALSVLFGAVRGLTREAITLIALFGGVVMVGLFASPLGGMLGDDLVTAIIVLVGLFAVGFITVHIGLEIIARRLIGATPKRPDRLLGGVFGLARGWFLVSLSFLALTYYFEAAVLPDAVAKAWSHGFAASGAKFLDAMGIAGDTDAGEKGEDDMGDESIEVIP